MTYSIDPRKHILDAKEDESLTVDKAAARFKVGRASILRCSKNIQPKTKRNKPPTKIDDDKLIADVEKYPDDYPF